MLLPARCGNGRRRRRKKKKETGVCAKSCSTHTHRENYYCRCSSSIHLLRHRDTKDIVDNARYIMDVSGINGGEALVLIKRQLWPGWGSISSIRIVIFIQKTRERQRDWIERDTLGDVAVVIPKHVHYVDMWIQPTARWRWYISTVESATQNITSIAMCSYGKVDVNRRPEFFHFSSSSLPTYIQKQKSIHARTC